jgi:hypothetical protein
MLFFKINFTKKFLAVAVKLFYKYENPFRYLHLSSSSCCCRKTKPYAKETSRKKDEIVAEVLTAFFKRKIADELAASFALIKDDPEQLFLAEAGMGDFLKIVEEFESGEV